MTFFTQSVSNNLRNLFGDWCNTEDVGRKNIPGRLIRCRVQSLFISSVPVFLSHSKSKVHRWTGTGFL